MILKEFQPIELDYTFTWTWPAFEYSVIDLSEQINTVGLYGIFSAWENNRFWTATSSHGGSHAPTEHPQKGRSQKLPLQWSSWHSTRATLHTYVPRNATLKILDVATAVAKGFFLRDSPMLQVSFYLFFAPPPFVLKGFQLRRLFNKALLHVVNGTSTIPFQVHWHEYMFTKLQPALNISMHRPEGTLKKYVRILDGYRSLSPM